MKQIITCDPIHEAVAKLESKHQKVNPSKMPQICKEFYLLIKNIINYHYRIKKSLWKSNVKSWRDNLMH